MNMNREILNQIYHAFTFHGVERKLLGSSTHFKNDLKLSNYSLNRIFMILQKKTGVRLVPVLDQAPLTIKELEQYIRGSVN